MKNFDSKIGLGYLIVTYLFILALVTALGKVVESSSAGLKEVITIFGMLASGFVGWAFGRQSNGSQPPDQKP